MNLRVMCASLVGLPAVLLLASCGDDEPHIATVGEMCSAVAATGCGAASECQTYFNAASGQCQSLIDDLLRCISPNPTFDCVSQNEGAYPVGDKDENGVALAYCEEEWVHAYDCADSAQ